MTLQISYTFQLRNRVRGLDAQHWFVPNEPFAQHPLAHPKGSIIIGCRPTFVIGAIRAPWRRKLLYEMSW
jgi:hypothetical protein